MTCRVEITVKGLVQGVSYRYTIFNVASRIGVAGYVKNQKDGSVLIVAEGSKKQLLILIDACTEGSIYSRVDRVSIKWHEAQNQFGTIFKIM